MTAAVKKAAVVDLTGRTGLGEAAAIFKKASFVVSGDSGPMHIASGVGTRVLALFGPTDPVLTGPRGVGENAVLSHVPEGYSVPWYGENFPEGGWLAGIAPEKVLETLREKGWLKSAGAATEAWPNTEKIKDRHVLVVTLSNIGDVILTTPVMTSLLKQYPGASLTVVCGPKAAPILQGSRAIDRLVIYDKKAALGEKIKMIRELRDRKYEAAVDLRNTAIPFLVSAKKKSPLFRKFNETRMRARHLEVLKMTGVEARDQNDFDFFGDSDLLRVLNKLKYKSVPSEKDWILVSPVAASSAKTWALEKFQVTVNRLLAASSAEILIVGDASGAEAGRKLAAAAPGRVFNLAGETSLRELAALMSRARLVVANDSAVMHLGYEMDRPVVAVFGPTDSEKYGHSGPLFKLVQQDGVCSPCEKNQCCFQTLDPERVFQACRELLERGARDYEPAHGRV